jgi:UDP-N-acetylmuramate dehydrogenase
VKFKKRADISELLTIKVKDAVCDLYFPEIIDDLVRFTSEFDDYRILSGGSNIIAGDVKKPVLYMGKAISTSDTDDVDEYLVKTFMPSWVSNAALLDYSIKNGLSGVEFLAGIPGNLGGALYGNAAPAGSSWDDVVGVIYVIQNGKVFPFLPRYSYRSLDNKPEGCFVIYGAELILTKDTSENVRSRILEFLSKRIKIKGHSAGSLFKNPKGGKAGRNRFDSGNSLFGSGTDFCRYDEAGRNFGEKRRVCRCSRQIRKHAFRKSFSAEFDQEKT